jgi:hypothetical protein
MAIESRSSLLANVGEPGEPASSGLFRKNKRGQMMKIHNQGMWLVLACLMLLFGLTWASTVQAEVSYSGRAFGALVNFPTLGIGPITLSDTGPLPPSGGFQSADLASAEVPGVLTASLLVASTSGANGVARSAASLANVVVLPENPAAVTASFVRAESEATCNGVRGTTEVADVTFGGQAITVDPFAPNQIFEIPGVARLVINEQTKTSGGGVQDITVNALHLTLLLTGDEVILSSAQSDVHGCPDCPPKPACADFMTGGGFINAGNSRANFGFNAGLKPNSSTPEIHFNYIDHNTGMHVKATSTSVYEQGDTPTTRHMEGNAEINGVPGFTYSIDAADNGEPGKNTDTLKISLSNGYSAGGTLAGGNLQLHKPACEQASSASSTGQKQPRAHP